jgi:hypothetical protein
VSLYAKKTGSFQARLARRYFDINRQTPTGGALDAAMTVLEGTPMETEPVFLRVALTPERSVVLDLATPAGEAVVIDRQGWQLVERSPVLFRRSALTSPLPAPEPGGSLDPLRQLVNVDESGFRLLVGWLLAALIADIPHPILALIGEQGTAKSTAAQLIVSLIDPSPAPLRTPPRDVRSWAVTAMASWTVALDNVSSIQPWFSDTLCKAVTGDGIIERTLHTDDDVTVLTFRRCVALTTIDAGTLAGDLAERLLPVELARITPDRRRSDAEITALYQAARPTVLGALLDLLAQVLTELPAVRLDELPRMADFARTLAALDAVTGWTTLADYIAAGLDATRNVVDSHPVAEAVTTLAAKGPWQGTAGDLLARITPDPAPRGWPTSPRGLAGTLRRLAPALRANGTAVEFDRSTDGTRRLIVLGAAQPSEPSEPSEDQP